VSEDTLESDFPNDDDPAKECDPQSRVKSLSEFKKGNFNEGLNIK
jgi:hypothetical protein